MLTFRWITHYVAFHHIFFWKATHEILYYKLLFYSIIKLLLLNSRKTSRWKLRFPIWNSSFPNSFLTWSKAFLTFLSASLCLLLTHMHLLCLVCHSWCLPMDFGCLAEFRSAQEFIRGQCRQHPSWNSLHRAPLPQSPDPKERRSPLALPGSSASVSLGVEQQKGKGSFTNCQLFYRYSTTQVVRWRDFFPCLKGFLLLTLHWLWHAVT